MVMGGKTIQLRASCNACNESKVRCSQQKPTCARCERNGNECIYGLSRRTHKDAPPISTPASSQRSRGPSRSSSNSDMRANSSGTTSNSRSRGQASRRSVTSTPSTSTSNSVTHDAGIFGDYISPAGPHFMGAPQQPPQHNSQGLHLLDFAGMDVTLNDPLNGVVSPFPTPGTEYNSWATDMTLSWARQTALAGPTTDSTPPPSGECTCHTGVMELLASMRGGGGDDRRLPMDAHLAKLKRCIVSSETSMGCTHDNENGEPIYIMAVATLIGYVINEFEMLASESPLRRSSSSAAVAAAAYESAAFGNTENASSFSSVSDEAMSGGHIEPRLSWGVLELEDDEEVDLRQMLYLLSFRKLERLLLQLTIYLRNLHDARTNRPEQMAFVMACDYMRLWLEKKADLVKKQFSIVDPTISHIDR
ncbi:hypothetical protein BS50DRAFT_676135 [Corynespora cassiicola Philippines]|uniref:Zn(2)-C6 fungal-type domain-containing protein n=1 Tax=Corynespora cassiicola Philippines TaxID=1448308 RepID=A0A2T2NS65_CORCC|nr:hypothetical protein BS50DRAFT_676135 [Corynespora cassiicola Philippines]